MGKRAHGEGTIYQRPDGRWAAAITIGFTPEGKQQRRFVYGKTQSQVRDKLRKLREMQAAGILPKPNRRTLTGFITEWLEYNQHRWSERTHEMYAFEAKQYVTPHLGSKGLSSIKPEHIARLQTKIATDHGKRTAEKTRSLLHKVFDYALRLQLVARNPVTDVPAIKAEPKQIEPVPLADLEKFLRECQGTRWYALFYLILVLGLRRGEALGLRWADVTRQRIVVRGSLKVVGNKPVLSDRGKTPRAARRLPIEETTWQVLVEHKRLQDEEVSAARGWQDFDLLFPNTHGRPLNPHNLYHRVLYPLQDRAGVDRFNLHQLRHTYVTMMIRQGANPKLLAERIGHARASFTMDRYAHLFEEQREQEAFALDHLMGLPDGN